MSKDKILIIKNLSNQKRKVSMNKNIKINLRYDGAALKDHAININVLGQSLTSLHELMKIASKISYGEEKEISIKANANVKQNCFELLLEFAGNLSGGGEKLLPFIADELRNILDLVGLTITAGNTTSNVHVSASFLDLIKLLMGKRITEEQIISKNAHGVNVKSENSTVFVVNNVYNIYQSPKAKKAAQGFIRPLEHEGFEKIVLKEGNNSQVIEKKEFKDFLSRTIDEDVDARETSIETITRDLTIYKPELNSGAKNWSFLLDGKPADFDISETDIAKKALERGEVRVGDTYKVKIEVRRSKHPQNSRPKYKIIKVLKFKRGRKQPSFFD